MNMVRQVQGGGGTGSVWYWGRWGLEGQGGGGGNERGRVGGWG